MSVVSEDVWSREASEEVILERRVVYGTKNQHKLVVGWLMGYKGPHDLILHR